MNNQIELELICQTQTAEAVQAKTEIQNLLQLISSMEISKIEEHIDEEFKSGKLEKYFLLAALRDAFIHYKSVGDTQLFVDAGTCMQNCYEGCSVYNLRGKKSNKNFAFVVEKENDKLKGIHFCSNFVNQQNENTPPDLDLYCNMMKKRSEFNKRDGSNWDTPKFRKTVEMTIKTFYSIGKGK